MQKQSMFNTSSIQTVVLFILAAFPWRCLAAPGDVLSQDIVVNGSFEVDANGDGTADGWHRVDGITYPETGGNRWMLIGKGQCSTGQTIPLKPEWGRLRLTMRMRVTDVILAKESWQTGRLAMSFHDASGKRVGNWPNVFHAVGTSDWIECEREYVVPRDATELRLGAANFGVSGKVEFDDIAIAVSRLRITEKSDAPLPEGIVAPWSTDDAYREVTDTHERICINGLWRFRPVLPAEDVGNVPVKGDCRGWFKVPGVWPSGSISDPDVAQSVVLAPWFEDSLDGTTFDQAWYERRIDIPAGWDQRRILVAFTTIQTHVKAFLDGKELTELWFPGGNLDLTGLALPGRSHTLSLLVTARPLESESNVFMAPDRIITRKASLKNKGIPGDVFLVGEPASDAASDVHVITSCRGKSITFDVGLRNPTVATCLLRADITRDGQQTTSFTCPDPVAVSNGRATFSAPWHDPVLWDTDTPGNVYTAQITVLTPQGQILDAALPVTFGFREFWIEGKDFFLNGKKIHLRALHNRNMNGPADQASTAGCKNTFGRMQEYGFNFLITGNYSFSPGEVSYMDGLLDAADQSGMLVSFSLPHVKDYNWKLDQEEQGGRYREMCDFLIRHVQNHPSLVTYAMNHNATGYYGDQNPQKMDGIYTPDSAPEGIEYKGDKSRIRRRQQAEMAASIAKSIDPTRPVYHHQSGNLGDMHTVNIYLNWAPMQERSDWLQHWATQGEKPMFFVEWGLPHISSWSSYRGPQFIWRCQAYQSIWSAEFAAAYLGDSAYEVSEAQRKALAFEENLWNRGEPFAWGHLCQAIRGVEQNHYEVKSLFAAENWRAHRTWGVSAMLPWDQGDFWERVKATPPKENPDRYKSLQRPGIIADRSREGSQFIYDYADGSFVPTSLGETFRRWNQPVCAFIGGDLGRFTEKSHNVLGGAAVKKSLVLLNDSRRATECSYTWHVVGTALRGRGTVRIDVGGKAIVPVQFVVPTGTKPGELPLVAESAFPGSEVQTDRFLLHVLPKAPSPGGKPILVFDPAGESTRLLLRLGIPTKVIAADDAVGPEETVVVGRGALSTPSSLPFFEMVPEGLRVLVLEQDAESLAERCGFRINVHGMRRTFVRMPGHRVFSGLSEAILWDWRGEATLVDPHLETEYVEKGNPKWTWCGFRNTRVWRCGNRGNVASVLIEKPCRGNWLPLVDCGFDLQYSPLLETIVGRGRIIFCQMDVSGRTEADPAADRLCLNLIDYLASVPIPESSRTVVHSGDGRSGGLLKDLGITAVEASPDPARDLWVIGPGGSPPPGGFQKALGEGLHLLCLGLSAEELTRWVPEISAEEGDTWYETIDDFSSSAYAGLSNAELYWRSKPQIAALPRDRNDATAGLRTITVGKGLVVLCQAAPWHFDIDAKPYLRTTQRRNLFLVSRLLGNLGAEFATPLIARLSGAPFPRSLPLAEGWVGMVDRERIGREGGWWQPDFDDSSWKPISVPGTFEAQRPELEEYNGLFWYRLRFRVPQALVAAEELELFLGGIDDESWIWLNGEFLGEVTKKTNPKDYWEFPRKFQRIREHLEPGENVVAVLVNDTYKSGGIMGEPRFQRPGHWLQSYYLQEPKAIDDPYRYYRW